MKWLFSEMLESENCILDICIVSSGKDFDQWTLVSKLMSEQ